MTKNYTSYLVDGGGGGGKRGGFGSRCETGSNPNWGVYFILGIELWNRPGTFPNEVVSHRNLYYWLEHLLNFQKVVVKKPKKQLQGVEYFVKSRHS